MNRTARIPAPSSRFANSRSKAQSVSTHESEHTHASSTRRVLMISYAFPPTGGGGVQRTVKFVKYLPQFGWRPTVLTAANPSVPVQDQDLMAEISSASTRILRAKTLEPNYRLKSTLKNSGGGSGRSGLRSFVRKIAMQVLQPDPQVLWNPSAKRTAARELMGDGHYDAIYATGPPFSSFLLGRDLKQRFGLPLIVDFRDEWLLASQHLDNYSLNKRSYRRQLRMLSAVLRSADAVVTTTKASAEELSSLSESCGAEPMTRCIYNGFDPNDLPRSSRHPTTSDRLRIVYTGTLWRLTDIQPLATALRSLAEIAPHVANRVDLMLVGRQTPQQHAIVQQLESTPIRVQCHDYMPHRQALDIASSADALLLLLANEEGAERVVPAKLFEYMALSKPILAVCPEGETKQLLRENGHTSHFHPNEVDDIRQWLMAYVPAGNQMQHLDSGHRKIDTGFSRVSQTHQLAELLDDVAAHKECLPT
ncbi:MAG: glycosyltransferase [Planctomycetota bacterium]